MPTEDFKGQLIRGAGNTDLICGACGHRIAEGMAAGQLRNLVLVCPNCRQHNAVVDIPQLEQIFRHLQKVGFSVEQIPVFKRVLTKAIEQKTTAKGIAEEIQSELPHIAAWFEQHFIPANAGEMYGLLSFLLMVVTWWQTRPTSEPQTVINNFFGEAGKKVGPNAPCPCGSGKKFKKCHGAKT